MPIQVLDCWAAGVRSLVACTIDLRVDGQIVPLHTALTAAFY